MIEIFVIFGMLAAFWSGFYVGYLKREDKPPEIPIPKVSVPTREKPERVDKDRAKENTFYS